MLVLAITFIMTEKGIASCDMMAMIAKKGNSIAWINGSESSWQLPDDPHDFFKFLYHFSPDNPDGYGIIYINSDGYIPEIDYPNTIGYPTQFYDVSEQAWYVIPNETYGTYTIELYDGPYEDAKSKILDSSNEVGIVLGHVRDASGITIGNHPFQIICDTNGDDIDETYMFMHNGNVTDMISTFRTEILSIDSDWFTNNPSNWEGSTISIDGWIDSEMYFHYIVAHIKEANGNIMKGIYNALSNVSADYQYQTSINTGMLYNYVDANFVLSDGENLYLYRNCDDDDHRLAYDEFGSGFFGVQTNNSMSQFTLMPQNSFTIISQYGDPVVMNQFLIADVLHTEPQYEVYRAYYKYNFISGEIDNYTPDLNIHYSKTYISGNTYILNGHTLDLDPEIVGTGTFFPEIKFAGHHYFVINGNLNVNEGASLNLSNSSTVEVSGSGLLFLDWGSKITGATKGYWEPIPPGHQANGEVYIYGDYIFAKNGGRITTQRKIDYDNYVMTHGTAPDSVEISTSSDDYWDGIFISNPATGADNEYWFVNCDISGISSLSMNKKDATETPELKLYMTDFTYAGYIHVNECKLTIYGGENVADYCNISHNNTTPVFALESTVDIKNANIEYNAGRGVCLRYASVEESKIENCYIQHNTKSGLNNYVENVTFVNNHVIDNSFGVYSYRGIFADFADNIIMNNNAAEYLGKQESFTWAGGNNHIEDESISGSLDQYVLMAYNWDEIHHTIDVRGNTILPQDHNRYYPCWDAFRFNGEIPQEREMLYSAFSDMKNKDYDNARVTLNQIMEDYPEYIEAITAVECLYYIENYTDKDYSALRNYLDEIQAEEGSELYETKEDVKTRTYMKEDDFLTAIDRLEEIINNPPTHDDSLYSLIDEAYCYLQLSEDSTRDMPVNCTVNPSTFAEYQKIVEELESRLSFFNEPEIESYGQEGETAILLHTSYPNPFNPDKIGKTIISFFIPSESKVELSVYNIKGQKVKRLINDKLAEGKHSIVWNGRDSSGRQVISGIYLYRIKAGNRTAVKKMLLMR